MDVADVLLIGEHCDFGFIEHHSAHVFCISHAQHTVFSRAAFTARVPVMFVGASGRNKCVDMLKIVVLKVSRPIAYHDGPMNWWPGG